MRQPIQIYGWIQVNLNFARFVHVLHTPRGAWIMSSPFINIFRLYTVNTVRSISSGPGVYAHSKYMLVFRLFSGILYDGTKRYPHKEYPLISGMLITGVVCTRDWWRDRGAGINRWNQEKQQAGEYSVLVPRP